MLSPSTILQKRYRIRRALAQGGRGAVYEAEAVHLGNRLVAVKEAFFSEDWLREQFQREAATLARLRHPALPEVSDHFSEGTGQFLVMEFIPGDNLGRLLNQRLKDCGEPFGWQVVAEWADRLLDVLEYIHGQHPPVFHRDIKPENLRLTPGGELFLLDFGLANATSEAGRKGTLAYAPPEQVKGTDTDARSDLYSLGATLYHLLTGQCPVDAEFREGVIRYNAPDPLLSADKYDPKVPAEIGEIIARAMSLNRDERYLNATAMRQMLRSARQNIEARLERQRREPAPWFFQDQTGQGLILQVNWFQKAMGISDRFFSKLLGIEEEKVAEWKSQAGELEQIKVDQLSSFWKTILHLLSYVDFELESLRTLFRHEVSIELVSSASPFTPPWVGTSLEDYLETHGSRGVQKVNYWVQSIRFANSY